jgi:signal transduction histidine kinase
MYAADLLTSVEKLNDSINEKIGNKDTSNIQIQMLMSALSLLLFFVLTFYFIRKNIVSDFVIFSEDREKKAILDNINEGLFLMDPDWVIQSEGSKFLHLLFNRKIPAGTNFRKLLSSSVDKETMDNAERFVSVLINKNIKGSMIDSLNPLKLISLNLKDTMNQNIVKHVSVHFGKIYDINGKLKHLLVGVVDSTEKHKLPMSLKEEIRKNKEAFSQLILIGKSQHREEIKNLMSSLFDYLSGINNRFKTGLLKSKEYQEVIREMKNSIHGFKNDAGLLEVDIIQKLLHDLEDYLIALDKSGNITSESFLNMPYQLKELFEAIDVINLLMGSGAQPSPQENAGQQDAEQPRSATIDWIKQSLSMAVEKTSKKAGKPVRFGESLVHLVKNSIIHGLETPSTREAAGKNQVGQLIVQGSINATMMKIKVRDDGAGINREAVQRKGIEKGLIAEGEELSQKQANELIFDPGFSTAEEVDFDAGRGVGLDQVRRAVTKLGGTITVASAEGKGTEFEITIPL